MGINGKIYNLAALFNFVNLLYICIFMCEKLDFSNLHYKITIHLKILKL